MHVHISNIESMKPMKKIGGILGGVHSPSIGATGETRIFWFLKFNFNFIAYMLILHLLIGYCHLRLLLGLINIRSNFFDGTLQHGWYYLFNPILHFI